ncbi:MAG: ABC transporter substrate-binding protein [Acidobacteriota bacterium]
MRRTRGGSRLFPALSAVLLIAVSGCGAPGTDHEGSVPTTTLRIGFGLVAGGSSDFGIGQAARMIAFDELVSVAGDGRARPSLAESWSTSTDGLTFRVRLRPSVTFDDGKAVDAEAVCAVLRAGLPEAMGPAFDDIAEIRATSDLDVEFRLRRRSTFVLEALASVAIADPTSKESGTGPFSVQSRRNAGVEMRANPGYFGGKPAMDRVILEPYDSVRSAWADMLRGQVDMLYEVGVDALDSFEASNEVNIFTRQRAYADLLLLNVQAPTLRDPGFRRLLNAAIDRRALIDDVLRGHGTPAEGPVSPRHWAYTADLPPFQYQPPASRRDRSPRRLTVLFSEPSLERLAIAMQRQMQAAGIELTLEPVSADDFIARVRSGLFEAALADYLLGPNLVRPYQYWHSNGAFNFGHYHNQAVDDALDQIRRAPDDDVYKAGVAAFWRAIVDDPPAVFLAWSERARAVSTRFAVPTEPDTDLLNTLHLWKPVSESQRRARR